VAEQSRQIGNLGFGTIDGTETSAIDLKASGRSCGARPECDSLAQEK
jgi:hypothetical protein